MRPISTTLVAVVFAAAVLPAENAARPYDAIVRHGTLVDGTGLLRYRADLAIEGGRIARIGDLASARAAIEIDATNLYVAPGFINIHSHASADALPRAQNMLTQGVTTEILNPDGGGPLDLAAQLSRLAERGLAVNVGAYIGFNSVWQSVMGDADRRPGAADIDAMRALVTRGLEQGAWGVSAGLDYKPAYFATTDEVIRVVDVARRWRTTFPNHDRLTPESGYSSRAGVSETIAIGEQAGLVPVVTHMKAQGHEQGTAPALLGLMQQAAARGHWTAADVYPYLAGQSGLGALIIPGWAQDGGRDEMLKRFHDPSLRARIVSEAEAAMTARFGGPQGVYLPATGRELVDVMREFQAPAGETLVRLLEQENMGAILRFGAEPDLIAILRHPTASIACDCGATTSTRTHPRNYGTFPRVLGHYVRETNTLTWEDAIRKMTGLPASTIGMVDRGLLAPGMVADVTVFDPNTVIDRATYDDPARLSQGIRDVFVNGTLVLRDGMVTDERPGRALTRTIHMPSRPMSVGAARRVTVRGPLETTDGREVALTVDLEQTSRRAFAKGAFRVTDARAHTTIEMVAPGILQTAPDWASFTGRVRIGPSGEERAVTAVFDGADVIIDAGEGSQFAGTLKAGHVRVSGGR